MNSILNYYELFLYCYVCMRLSVNEIVNLSKYECNWLICIMNLKYIIEQVITNNLIAVVLLIVE